MPAPTFASFQMPYSIHIIEDQAPLVLMMRLYLEAQGFQVSWSLNGEAGLTRAHEQPPDLVLLDLTLPRLSGVDVCLRLKADPVTHDIPVVFLSGTPPEELEAIRASAGADGCVSKPHDSKALVALIHRLLEQRARPPQINGASPPRAANTRGA